jgi:heat shock protein HslJ
MKNLILKTLPVLILAALALTACGSANTLSGTTWTLVSYGDTAAPTAAASGVDTSLAFNKNGTLGGSMGCNGFGGDYSVKGSQIVFGSLFSTEMACDEPRMSQETTTFAIMAGTVDFTLSGDSLTITSTDGSRVLNLIKK